MDLLMLRRAHSLVQVNRFQLAGIKHPGSICRGEAVPRPLC